MASICISYLICVVSVCETLEGAESRGQRDLGQASSTVFVQRCGWKAGFYQCGMYPVDHHDYYKCPSIISQILPSGYHVPGVALTISPGPQRQLGRACCAG